MLATVKYQIATYKGEISVNVTEDAEDDEIIAKAKRILISRVGHLPYGYEKWEVVSRR